MVYTLKDLKHLETIANLQSKEVEQPKPIFVQAQDTSLTATLLKLCNKLRAEGYNKYAESIENKFVNYKTAGVHLYQAHKETGEDLVDQAHPYGDNKIVPDVSDNNGDVETIVSRHKKIVDIVNKQPTGKLASYVEQCKIALGQDIQENIASLANAAKHNITQAYTMAEGIGGMSNSVFSLSYGRSAYINFMKMMNIQPITVSNLKDAEEALNYFESSMEPHYIGNGGVDEEVWPKVKPFIDATRSNLNNLRKLVIQYYSNTGGETSSGEQENISTEGIKSVLSATIDKIKSELEQARSLEKSVDQFTGKATDQGKSGFLNKVKGSIGSYITDISSVLNKLVQMETSGQRLDLNNLSQVVGGVQRFSNVDTYAALKSAIAAYHTRLGQAFNYMKQW